MAKRLNGAQQEALPAPLKEFYKKWQGKTVIATLYQLGTDPRRGKEAPFTTELKQEVIRKEGKVEAEHFVKVNAFSEQCGRHYVLDEKKSEEFQKELADHIQGLQEKWEGEKAAQEALVGALKNTKKAAGASKKPGASK